MARGEGERIESPPEIAPVPAGRRSLRMQLRYIRTLLFALRLFARVVVWQVIMPRLIGQERADQGSLARWVKTAREFRAYAIRMGGVMIKLGQFVSSRVDVLPPEITSELAGLQDEVPPVPHDRIMAVMQAEPGALLDKFDQIDTTAIAAASLGQVYRARLKDGERVVIKVQRPGIRDIVYTDLAALRIVARIAKRFRFISRRADTVALAQEFGRVLLEELSYKREAYNGRRFARMFKDDHGIYIPAIYGDLSTDSVLVMEDVTTIKVNDYAALEAAGINRNTVAKRLMDCYMKQVFEERFFHADPHPGNLFVYPLPQENGSSYGKSGRPFYLIFVDFGMTGTLSPTIASGLINTLAAIVNRDADKMVRSFQELGFLLPDADVERIEEATKAAFDQVWGLSMTEIKNVSYAEARDLASEFNDLIFSMPFQVPQDFIYLGRCMGILSGMATSLDPTFNPWQELQPYAQKMMARTLKNGANVTTDIGIPILQGLLTGNPAQVLSEVGKTVVNRAVIFPQQVDRVLTQIERGDVNVRVSPSATYRKQMQRIEAQGRRTVRAVISGSLLVSSTLLYTNGDIVPATIGYIFSGIMILSLWFGGE